MVATFVPVDGRLTSLQALNIPLTGGEVMEIVSPGTAAGGNNYQVTTAVLAAYFSSFSSASSTVITTGATIGSPYMMLISDTKVLFNKAVGSASYIVAPIASTVLSPYTVLIKDLNGDAATNNITLTFSGGELCDGNSQLVIDSPYGWIRATPTPGGGSWYQS